jgi:hypothetical protein
MTRNQAQARLSSGLPVYVQVRGDSQRHQVKSIGLTICHSMGNRKFDNKSVEFTV